MLHTVFDLAAQNIYTITTVSRWATKISANSTNSVLDQMWDMIIFLSSVTELWSWTMARKMFLQIIMMSQWALTFWMQNVITSSFALLDFCVKFCHHCRNNSQVLASKNFLYVVTITLTFDRQILISASWSPTGCLGQFEETHSRRFWDIKFKRVGWKYGQCWYH